jgi:hypothetical protein
LIFFFSFNYDFSSILYAQVIPLRGYALISTPTQGLLLFNTTAVRESAGVTYLGKMEPPSSSAKASCKAGTALLKAAPAAASVPGTAAQKLPEVLIAVASSPACGNDDAETSAFDASGPSQLKVRCFNDHTRAYILHFLSCSSNVYQNYLFHSHTVSFHALSSCICF